MTKINEESVPLGQGEIEFCGKVIKLDLATQDVVQSEMGAACAVVIDEIIKNQDGSKLLKMMKIISKHRKLGIDFGTMSFQPVFKLMLELTDGTFGTNLANPPEFVEDETAAETPPKKTAPKKPKK